MNYIFEITLLKKERFDDNYPQACEQQLSVTHQRIPLFYSRFSVFFFLSGFPLSSWLAAEVPAHLWETSYYFDL